MHWDTTSTINDGPGINALLDFENIKGVSKKTQRVKTGFWVYGYHVPTVDSIINSNTLFHVTISTN
jgi:hypothetical protein